MMIRNRSNFASHVPVPMIVQAVCALGVSHREWLMLTLGYRNSHDCSVASWVVHILSRACDIYASNLY